MFSVGRWYWKGRLADTPITVTDWAHGEPNNALGYEDCVYLNVNGASHAHYAWNDAPCALERSYICEINNLIGEY